MTQEVHVLFTKKQPPTTRTPFVLESLVMVAVCVFFGYGAYVAAPKLFGQVSFPSPFLLGAFTTLISAQALLLYRYTVQSSPLLVGLAVLGAIVAFVGVLLVLNWTTGFVMIILGGALFNRARSELVYR